MKRKAGGMAARAGRELMGLAVVSLGDGQRAGRIEDIVFSASTGRITGFLVDGGGLFSKPRFLPAGQVRGLGTDALTVESREALQDSNPAQTDPDEFSARSLDGRPVLSDAGTVLGKVADVLVDTEKLAVSALSLSTGLIDNALHGKPYLPIEMVKAVGKDSLVVPSSYDPKATSSHTPWP